MKNKLKLLILSFIMMLSLSLGYANVHAETNDIGNSVIINGQEFTKEEINRMREYNKELIRLRNNKIKDTDAYVNNSKECLFIGTIGSIIGILIIIILALLVKDLYSNLFIYKYLLTFSIFLLLFVFIMSIFRFSDINNRNKNQVHYKQEVIELKKKYSDLDFEKIKKSSMKIEDTIIDINESERYSDE